MIERALEKLESKGTMLAGASEEVEEEVPEPFPKEVP